MKTILPFQYMDIKSGISPCGKNIDETLMEKIFKIFGFKESKRKLEITEPWRASLSLDVTDVCRSKRIRWEGNVSGLDEFKSAYKILVGKPVHI